MAIQSNQPSVNWVLVSSRCPWSRLVKSREIVHPGEREAWGGGFVLWCSLVSCFEEILRVVLFLVFFFERCWTKEWGAVWHGEECLQASGKLFFVIQGTVSSSLMCFLFMCMLFLKYFYCLYCSPLGWNVYIILHKDATVCVHCNLH